MGNTVFRKALGHLAALVATAVALLAPALASAAPEARILRIDPRAAQDNSGPILTTVVEVSQSKRVSDAIAECAALRGDGQLDCMSQSLEKPFALYTPFPFPAANALFTVTVDGGAVPARSTSAIRSGVTASSSPAWARLGSS